MKRVTAVDCCQYSVALDEGGRTEVACNVKERVGDVDGHIYERPRRLVRLLYVMWFQLGLQVSSILRGVGVHLRVK